MALFLHASPFFYPFAKRKTVNSLVQSLLFLCLSDEKMQEYLPAPAAATLYSLAVSLTFKKSDLMTKHTGLQK